MEQKIEEVDRTASPKDEMRVTSQALHSRIDTGGKFRCQTTNHTMSVKDKEMENHQPQKCGTGTGGETCSDVAKQGERVEAAVAQRQAAGGLKTF